jgi:hypothetical protein
VISSEILTALLLFVFGLLSVLLGIFRYNSANFGNVRSVSVNFIHFLVRLGTFRSVSVTCIYFSVRLGFFGFVHILRHQMRGVTPLMMFDDKGKGVSSPLLL